MIFDLRTSQQKEIQRKNGCIRNFRLQCNVWEERPQLIWSEPVELLRSTRVSSIYNLKEQNQIVYISVNENKLSDKTKITGTKWSKLKQKAMTENFERKTSFVSTFTFKFLYMLLTHGLIFLIRYN